MIRYFLKTLGLHFRSGRTLFLLSVLGIALGVASVLSVQIINRSALGTFEGSVRAVSGDADLSVLGRGPDIAETLVPRVLALPGVKAAWPIYRVDVALANEDRFFLEVLGLDLFAQIDVPWEIIPEDPAQPLSRRGWVAVSPRLAQRFDWTVGDPFEVTSGSRRVELVVGAQVDFHSISPLASSRMVVMDIAQAQDLFGRRRRIDQIDVLLHRGTDSTALARRLERDLGPTVRVRTPEQRRGEAANLIRAFRLNLTALSLVSLFVGGFLVYVSTQAALVRRRREFGLLRWLGMTRLQMLALIGGEVTLLGLLGVMIGIPLGHAVAVLNVETVSASLTNFYLRYEIENLSLPPWLYVLAAAIGIGAAIAAASLPAVELGRKEIRQLLAAYNLHERIEYGADAMFAIGCLNLALVWLIAELFLKDWKPSGFLVGLALLVALPLTTPWILQRATRRIRVRSFGLFYGARAVGSRLHATTPAVAALAVAISMLIGITILIGSFRRTVDIWISATLRADVYITTESWRRARTSAVLDAELVDQLSSLAGVEAVDLLRQFFADAGDRRISLVGVDMGLPARFGRFEMLQGRLDEALRRVRDEDAVIISEPLARKAGLGIGDVLTVSGPRGPVDFAVAGVSFDYSNEAGGAAMDLATMERHFGSGPINNMALYLRPGVEAQRVVDALKARYADTPLSIRSNQDLREEVLRVFDQTFAVTRLLQGMSLLIAVCGVTLTLIVLARERVAELALYRALGAGRGRIFRVFLGQGVGIFGFGLLLGSVGGTALAMILIYLINRPYFGWTIAVHWPWGTLAQQTLTIFVAAVLASIYPAARASRTPATELSREDL